MNFTLSRFLNLQMLRTKYGIKIGAVVLKKENVKGQRMIDGPSHSR